MRIISQFLDYDIPYELSNLFIVQNIIYASNSASSRILMGEYLSKDEAEKVFLDIISKNKEETKLYFLPKRGFANE